jgi:integrin beta 3
MSDPVNRASRTTPPPKKASAWAAVHKLITALMGRVSELEARKPEDGKPGVSISDALIDADGNLVLTLTNGEVKRLGRVVGQDGDTPVFEPPEKPKDGEPGVGISGAEQNADGDLLLVLTNGQTLNVGRVKGQDGISPTLPKFTQPKDGDPGRSITGVFINSAGNLVVSFSDGQTQDVGRVVGHDGVSPDTPVFETPKDGDDGVGIKSALMDRDGNLILTFTNGDVVNVGRVKGQDGVSPTKPEDGKPGVGIKSALIDNGGDLILTLTNGETLDLGRVVGADGVSPDPLPPLPAQHGKNGKGIASAFIAETGNLVLKLTPNEDGSVDHIDVGRVKGADGVSPEKPADGNDGVSVIGAYLEDDVLKMELTGGARIVVGKIEPRKGDKGDAGVGINAAELVNGELVLSFTDGHTQNVGKLPVAKAPKAPTIDVPEISVSEPYAHNLTAADLEFLTFRDLTVNGVTFQVLSRG